MEIVFRLLDGLKDIQTSTPSITKWLSFFASPLSADDADGALIAITERVRLTSSVGGHESIPRRCRERSVKSGHGALQGSGANHVVDRIGFLCKLLTGFLLIGRAGRHGCVER